jgi:hypothetical protein
MRSSFLFLLIVVGTLVLSMTACKNSLSKEAYIQWMKDEKNGLLKKKEIGDLVFEVQYKSPEMTLIGEMNRKDWQGDSKVNSNMQFFDLKIKHKGGQDFIKTNSADQTEYYNRLYYFSFGFQNDIKMIEKEKEYNCELFHFERSYGLTAAKTFVLGFELPKGNERSDQVLTIDANTLGAGIVKIKFNKEDIENIPTVVL